MTQQISPFIEAKYGWNFGEGGWNSGMDENLTKFSFLFDRNIDAIVSTLPSSPVNGQAFFLTTDNRMYFRVDSSWYSTPTPKWFEIQIRATGEVYRFNGSSLEVVESSSSIDNRIDALEITASSLGTAAYEDVEFFATRGELDVVEAESADYTDKLRQDLANPDMGAGMVGFRQAGDGAAARPLVEKVRETISVKDFGASGDGVTDDQSAIESAVAAAYSTGVALYWPAGVYLSSNNIPLLHEIEHVGSGGIKRGSNVFYFLNSAQNHYIYMSADGDDSYDGMSPDFGIKTPARMSDLLLKRYLLKPTPSTLVVELGEGTFYGGFNLVNVNATPRLIVRGRGYQGAGLTLLEGAGTGSNGALYFNGNIRGEIQNLAMNNFTSGLTVRSGAYMSGKDLRASNIAGAAFAATHEGRLVLSGDIVAENFDIGVSVYQLSSLQFLSGNLRVASDNRSGSVGVQVRELSRMILRADTRISGVGTAFNLMNGGVLSSLFSPSIVLENVSRGALVQRNSAYNSGPVTYATPLADSLKLSVSGNSSAQDVAVGAVQNSLGEYAFGGDALTAPRWRFHFIGKDGASGIPHFYSDLTVDSVSNAYAALVAGGGTADLTFRTPSTHYGIRHLVGDNSLRFYNGAGRTFLVLSGAAVSSLVDNDVTLGTASRRWSQLYAASGTINTSDVREKTPIRPQDEREKAAALEIKASIGAFQFTGAVSEKGEEGARIHWGVGAQTVGDILRRHGLNPERYAFWCYDAWAEQPEVRDAEGNIEQEYQAAGNRYGVRYDELAMFILAAL